MKTHETDFQCKVCNQCVSSANRIDLEIHYARHSKQKTQSNEEKKAHKCPQCDFNTIYVADLMIHMTRIHTELIKDFKSCNPSPSDLLVGMMLEQSIELQQDVHKMRDGFEVVISDLKLAMAKSNSRNEELLKKLEGFSSPKKTMKENLIEKSEIVPQKKIDDK